MDRQTDGQTDRQTYKQMTEVAKQADDGRIDQTNKWRGSEGYKHACMCVIRFRPDLPTYLPTYLAS